MGFDVLTTNTPPLDPVQAHVIQVHKHSTKCNTLRFALPDLESLSA